MKKESKTVVHDGRLQLEACRFEGLLQPFPNHFHDYYVIGLVEKGMRALTCMGREYQLADGSIVLFNPGDNHACVQNDGGSFDYRSIHITQEVMPKLTEAAFGERMLPGFTKCAILDEEAVCCFRALHEMILKGAEDSAKEELLLLFLTLLVQRYGQPCKSNIPGCRQETERACAYMEQHFAERICLDQICRHVGLGKSTLLRAFTGSKGITPYRYLETVRISEAKKLLEKGILPVEAAIQTGFSDQSHFTNVFTRLTGLTPGMYRDCFADRRENQNET